MDRKTLFVSVLLSALFFLSCGCQTRSDLIDLKCGTCHDVSIVYEKKRSPEEWDRLLFGMKARGMKTTEREEEEIRRFLERYLAP